jgi:hypothetical protein
LEGEKISLQETFSNWLKRNNPGKRKRTTKGAFGRPNRNRKKYNKKERGSNYGEIC